MKTVVVTRILTSIAECDDIFDAALQHLFGAGYIARHPKLGPSGPHHTRGRLTESDGATARRERNL